MATTGTQARYAGAPGSTRKENLPAAPAAVTGTLSATQPSSRIMEAPPAARPTTLAFNDPYLGEDVNAMDRIAASRFGGSTDMMQPAAGFGYRREHYPYPYHPFHGISGMGDHCLLPRALASGLLAPGAMAGGLGGMDLLPYTEHLRQEAIARLPPMLRCDVRESDTQFEVLVDVPGVPKEGVTVEVSADNVLSIRTRARTETTDDSERRGWRFHRQERASTSAWRDLQLPAACDTGSIAASVRDGVLCVVVPKHAGQQPSSARRIDVN